MKPKLSIIIPCYNCSKTIAQAVASCHEQGFSEEEFEIVMVDDCSTDSTFEVIKALQTKHNNIKVFHHEKNRGGGATRNTAVSKATSEVVFCLDSDDLLPPSTLRSMLEHLEHKKCDGVGVNFSTKFIGDDISNIYRVDTFSYADERIPFENLFEKEGMMCSLYSVFMFTKKAFAIAGGYPEDHGFDTQGFAWRFLSKNLYAETCPNTNYLHRIKAGKSYYLREYASGNTNFNWQKVFLEHFNLFNSEAQRFILTYNCQDFTKSIFNQLKQKGRVLDDNFEEKIRSGNVKGSDFVNPNQPISKNSLTGVLYRIKHKLKQTKFTAKLLTVFLSPARAAVWEIRSRLLAKNQLQLITALLGLKLKRVFKRHFIMPEPAERTVIDIVIPTLNKDAALLDTYLSYLKKNLSHDIGSIYVVTPATDSDLVTYCKENALHFIDEKSVLGYGKNAIEYKVGNIDRSGWLFQQLLKLSGDKFVTNQKYLIVDSDTVLINKHCFFSDGKTVFLESSEWNEPYFAAFKRLFGYKSVLPLSLTSHMMLFDVTMLREMKDDIEKLHGISWDQAYINSCDKTNASGISDYETYAQWLIAKHPSEYLTVPFYNKSLPRREFDSIDTLSAKYSKRFNSLSFHSYN